MGGAPKRNIEYRSSNWMPASLTFIGIVPVLIWIASIQVGHPDRTQEMQMFLYKVVHVLLLVPSLVALKVYPALKKPMERQKTILVALAIPICMCIFGFAILLDPDCWGLLGGLYLLAYTPPILLTVAIYTKQRSRGLGDQCVPD